MAFFACGARDKLNARPAGATRHFVDDGSLFGTGLIFSRCKALLVRVGLGRLSFEGRFWDMPENLPLSSHVGREVVLPCGSESLRLPTRKASRSAMRSRGLFLWLGRRDSASACRRPRPAASLRSLRAALENASRFLSSAPLRVRIPPLAHKKAPWAAMSSGRFVSLAGTEGFEPPTAGTKNRSSTVELRPSMGVAKSNSSSLPNLQGHRKRHRVGALRASGRRLP